MYISLSRTCIQNFSNWHTLFALSISIFSIYTLSDLGDLSNLINGSQSRAIQQYSPPSEWIMPLCELGVFPIF